MSPSAHLIQQLLPLVRQQRHTTQAELAPLPADALNAQPRPGAWSALECLEHLNRYARYYLPVLARALATAGPAAPTAAVRTTWLGRKSLAIVRPDNGQQHKTVKHMNPTGSRLDYAVLREFARHQDELEHLLTLAATADLNRRAVPVEFFRLLKLRTGEALEFVVQHQERHLQQALRAARLALVAAPVLVV